MKAKNHSKLQEEFFRKAGPNIRLLRDAFDTLRDVGFYITDNQDRLMAFTRHNCEECNIADESLVIGKTCSELFPPILASVYMKRDQEVRKTGKPIVNQAYTHSVDRSTDMRIVSVFPILDRHRKILGTYCIHRSVSCGDSLPDWYGRIRSVIAHIDIHYADPLTNADLAMIAKMNVTTFRRAFKEIMQMTPAKYLNTIRLNAARHLLTSTDMLVSDIAIQTGFWDQSHFTKAFKSIRGQTPSQYRRQHWIKNL